MIYNDYVRKIKHRVKIGNKFIGGDSKILVQSMTNTDTENVDTTLDQIIELYDAGSEIVRITVNTEAAAKNVPIIKNKLIQKGYDIPLVGCFHYNGHDLLSKISDCASALDKYRINPGNVGFGNKRDKNFEKIIEIALINNKPVRIGVNWGSLDKELLSILMEENKFNNTLKSSDSIIREALIRSCLISAEKAKNLGMSEDKIILSCKTSKVQDLLYVYRKLSEVSSYALHLGLTEAGMGMKGSVSTSVALGVLLNEGIGDTIRASITPLPNAARTDEVKLCLAVLQALELRKFIPEVTSCPGCGRTTSDYFQRLALDINQHISNSIKFWSKEYPGVENLKIAVMGCIVNGPGESKHADVGISLPGTGEEKIAPVFIDGIKKYTLRGENISNEFIEIVDNYIRNRYEKSFKEDN